MMNKKIISVLLMMIFSSYTFAADENVTVSGDSNESPCAVLLCMAGKTAGQAGGDDCSGAEKKFFSIIKTKKGKFNASRTFDARKSFLNQCPTPDSKAISDIMSKYGKVRM